MHACALHCKHAVLMLHFNFSWFTSAGGCCCSHLVPAPLCRWCAATTHPPSPSTSGRARRRSGGWRLCNSKWQASSCMRASQGGCLVLVPLSSFTSTAPQAYIPHFLCAGTRTFPTTLSRPGGSQWATTLCRCGRGCMDSHSLRWMRLRGCLFFPWWHTVPPCHLPPCRLSLPCADHVARRLLPDCLLRAAGLPAAAKR